MIDFTLTDEQSGQHTSYSLPTRWEDVTWAQYQDYVALNELDFESAYDKTTQQLAVLARIDVDLLNATGWQVVVELLKHLTFLQKKPKAYPIAHVRIGSETYYPQKLVPFGEVVAYDKVLNAGGMNFEQKLPYLLAISLRQRVSKSVTRRVSRGWKRLLKLEETVVVETQEAEPFQDSSEWMESRATLFAHALNVTQVQALGAFFLGSATFLQSVFHTFSKLQSRILRQKESLERVSAAITAGNWQSGIFAPLLLKSLSCYFYLLNKYFNASNINELLETKSAASNASSNTPTTPRSTDSQ